MSLLDKINELKTKYNAIILAHNYQRPEVQDIADFVGDSLELIRKAVETDADVIIFCGVLCMAETVAIACPDKIVILPDMNAGCTLANMITLERFMDRRNDTPKLLYSALLILRRKLKLSPISVSPRLTQSTL